MYNEDVCVCWFLRAIRGEGYLRAAATDAADVRAGGLAQVGLVVEDLLVAAAWLVLHVVHRADLALRLYVQLLRLDLRKCEAVSQRS